MSAYPTNALDDCSAVRCNRTAFSIMDSGRICFALMLVAKAAMLDSREGRVFARFQVFSVGLV